MTLLNQIYSFFKDTPKKCFAVMYFNTAINLNKGTKPDTWLNFNNKFFTSGKSALIDYANNDSHFKELVEADSPDELLIQMLFKIDNYNDKHWREINVYPYL